MRQRLAMAVVAALVIAGPALAKVTRQALDNGLKQDRPTIEIAASRGFCRVTIETPAWRLWSEARDGKIVDHGASIR
jgi:hypothetical protein